MKFLNINDRKLKVTLSADECVARGIDTAKSEYTRAEIREVIRDILAEAESECGFSVTGEKILVQFYPLPSGECEILIAKLTGVSRKEKGMIRSADGLTTLEKGRGIYRFDTREALLRAARAIYREGIECDLYEADGAYYISIREELTDGISEFEVLIEYGDRLSSLPVHILAEYGRLVSDGNALDKIIEGDF